MTDWKSQSERECRIMILIKVKTGTVLKRNGLHYKGKLMLKGWFKVSIMMREDPVMNLTTNHLILYSSVAEWDIQSAGIIRSPHMTLHLINRINHLVKFYLRLTSHLITDTQLSRWGSRIQNLLQMPSC